jgi:hypothetical protein
VLGVRFGGSQIGISWTTARKSGSGAVPGRQQAAGSRQQAAGSASAHQPPATSPSPAPAPRSASRHSSYLSGLHCDQLGSPIKNTNTEQRAAHRSAALPLWLRAPYVLCARAARSSTASQLVRSVFQSTMGSYEGAFSAEPAAVDHPRGGWGVTRGPVVGTLTHPPAPDHAKPGCALGNEPAPAARGAGGCQVVGAGPHPLGLRRN